MAARLGEAMAGLAAETAPLRERARAQLMELHRPDLAMLRRTVAEARPLLPSQMLALREIVTQVYLSDEPYAADAQAGFLGVVMGEVSIPVTGPATTAPGNAVGVVIVERLAGFCGYRTLSDGDIVLAAEELPESRLRGPGDLAAVIRAGRAGSTVHLSVLRQGQVIRVPIRLDARPAELDGGQLMIREMTRQRLQKADDYWDQTFAPLIGDGVG